jgi:hypothetical protein
VVKVDTDVLVLASEVVEAHVLAHAGNGCLWFAATLLVPLSLSCVTCYCMTCAWWLVTLRLVIFSSSSLRRSFSC